MAGTTNNRWNFALLIAATMGVCSFFLHKLPTGIYLSSNLLGIFTFVILATLAKFFEQHIPKKPFQFISQYAYTAFLLHHIMLNEIVKSAKGLLLLQPFWNYIMLLFVVFIVFAVSFMFYNMIKYLLQTPIFFR